MIRSLAQCCSVDWLRWAVVLTEPEEMPAAPVGSIMMMGEETSLADTDDLSRFSLLAAIAEEAGNE